MATVKQVLAAISQDGTLGPNQKRFVTDAIQRAETWVNLNAPKAPRKVTNAKNLMTIEDWEAIELQQHGSPYNLGGWIIKNNLDHKMVYSMLDEFRSEMKAKGKQYANFSMAFMTYLTKGYLSKTLQQCVAMKTDNGATINNRGVNL